MQLKGNPSIVLTKPDNSTETLKASFDGNVVTLATESPIAVDGQFTITVPAGSFINSEGFENEELTYTFNVVVPHNTLKFASVTPNQGEVVFLTNTISLVYKEAVKLAEGAQDIKLYKDAQEFATLQLS